MTPGQARQLKVGDILVFTDPTFSVRDNLVVTGFHRDYVLLMGSGWEGEKRAHPDSWFMRRSFLTKTNIWKVTFR